MLSIITSIFLFMFLCAYTESSYGDVDLSNLASAPKIVIILVSVGLCIVGGILLPTIMKVIILIIGLLMVRKKIILRTKYYD